MRAHWNVTECKSNALGPVTLVHTFLFVRSFVGGVVRRRRSVRRDACNQIKSNHLSFRRLEPVGVDGGE